MSKRKRLPEIIFEQTIAHFLKPVGALMSDDEVSDILINGPFEVYVERRGRLSRTQQTFDSSEALDAAVKNIAQFLGKTIDRLHPMLDGRLPDGSRVQITVPPCARSGPYISIRCFRRHALQLDDLLREGTLDDVCANLLCSAVAGARNVLVAGGTGSGKTTLLNVLSASIHADERIIVIEDAGELQLQQPHVVSLESRPPDKEGRGEVTIRELLRGALRMRPDRILIGEIRAGEALDLIQAMTSGHGGALSTIHASSPLDALYRLETMALMANTGIPLRALRSQIASALDLIVQVERRRDGSRQVISVHAVNDVDNDGRIAVGCLLDRSGAPTVSNEHANPLSATDGLSEYLGLLGAARHST